jgi:hypothetical protein
VFALVNLSLWRIKRADADHEDEAAFRLPIVLPLVGFVACSVVLGYRVWELTIG